MNSIKRTLAYGFLLWVIPFGVAIAIFPLRETQYPFFETIMPVTLTVTVVVLSALYLGRVEANPLNEAIKLGLIWFGMSLLLDLPLFLRGPMQMSFVDYMQDIGLTYLIYPIVTVGFGYLLGRKAVAVS